MKRTRRERNDTNNKGVPKPANPANESGGLINTFLRGFTRSDAIALVAVIITIYQCRQSDIDNYKRDFRDSIRYEESRRKDSVVLKLQAESVSAQKRAEKPYLVVDLLFRKPRVSYRPRPDNTVSYRTYISPVFLVINTGKSPSEGLIVNSALFAIYPDSSTYVYGKAEYSCPHRPLNNGDSAICQPAIVYTVPIDNSHFSGWEGFSKIRYFLIYKISYYDKFRDQPNEINNIVEVVLKGPKIITMGAELQIYSQVVNDGSVEKLRPLINKTKFDYQKIIDQLNTELSENRVLSY